MVSRRRSPGFTLIEVMIVVAIVAVLAVLAIVGYRRWVKSSYVAEAQDMVSNIRTAESSFFAENGAYYNVTGSPASPARGAGNSYPATNPGAFVTEWGADCASCSDKKAWQKLGVQSSGPVRWGYSVMAGDGVQVAASLIGGPTVNGKALDYSAMSSPVQPWFFIEADANVSGDGVNFMHVYAMSGTNVISVDGEGK